MLLSTADSRNLNRCFFESATYLKGVGVLGFEPRTSALSELRSSQLSYTP